MLSPTARKMYFVLYSYINAVFGSTNPSSTCVSRKRCRIHNHRVKSLVPPGKLLVYNVKQGWKPLCDFLGCEVSTVAFPHEAKSLKFLCLRQDLVRAGNIGDTKSSVCNSFCYRSLCSYIVLLFVLLND